MQRAAGGGCQNHAAARSQHPGADSRRLLSSAEGRLRTADRSEHCWGGHRKRRMLIQWHGTADGREQRPTKCRITLVPPAAAAARRGAADGTHLASDVHRRAQGAPEEVAVEDLTETVYFDSHFGWHLRPVAHLWFTVKTAPAWRQAPRACPRPSATTRRRPLRRRSCYVPWSRTSQ